MTENSLGSLIGKYIQVRDKRDELKKEHKEQLAPYNEAMFKLEDHFHKHLDKMELENLKCEEGTAYKSIRTAVTVADWDAFLDYVKGEGAWHILEKRASKTAIEEIIEDTGETPPGLNIKRDVKINVRRS